MLEGPTAVIFCGKDVVLAAKAVSAFAREHRLPVLKGGHIEGKAIEAAQAAELATLPPRQELIARLVGLVAGQTPAGFLVSSLQAVLGRLVGTLTAYCARIEAASAGDAQTSGQSGGAA
jgi:large subunit ribosomal protein L10